MSLVHVSKLVFDPPAVLCVLISNSTRRRPSTYPQCLLVPNAAPFAFTARLHRRPSYLIPVANEFDATFVIVLTGPAPYANALAVRGTRTFSVIQYRAH